MFDINTPINIHWCVRTFYVHTPLTKILFFQIQYFENWLSSSPKRATNKYWKGTEVPNPRCSSTCTCDCTCMLTRVYHCLLREKAMKRMRAVDSVKSARKAKGKLHKACEMNVSPKNKTATSHVVQIHMPCMNGLCAVIWYFTGKAL